VCVCVCACACAWFYVCARVLLCKDGVPTCQKLEGAIVIATALVTVVRMEQQNEFDIEGRLSSRRIIRARAIHLEDKPVWISVVDDDTSLRRRHWVTSTATARGRWSNSPTAEFQFLEFLRRRVVVPGRERDPSAGVHSSQWGETIPYPPTGPVDSPPWLPHPSHRRRCCIFQRFKFRKFEKFCLLELFFDCGISTHDFYRKICSRKDTKGTLDRRVSLCARRVLFDPHSDTSTKMSFWQNQSSFEIYCC